MREHLGECSPARRQRRRCGLGRREFRRCCSRRRCAGDAGSGNLVSAVADAALINGVRARLQPSSAEIHLIASPISSRRPAPLPKCLPHFTTCSLSLSRSLSLSMHGAATRFSFFTQHTIRLSLAEVFPSTRNGSTRLSEARTVPKKRNRTVCISRRRR